MSSSFSTLKSLIQESPLIGVAKKPPYLGLESGLSAPEWIHDGPIYEVFVRNFSPSGDFKGILEKIPYLKDLGIGTLWLMPIQPVGLDGRKGTLGSPYSIKDYKAINHELGNKAQLKKLIDAVHQQGMHIIVDLVINHTANDHIAIKDQPGMFQKNANGKPGRKIADWSDITDLNYDKSATRSYIKDMIEYWIKEFKFDGFRCDVAGMVPLDFWEQMVTDLKKVKPDIFMLAEWEDPIHHLNAFHSHYDWTLYLLLKDIRTGKKPANLLLELVKQKQQYYPSNALPLRFLENHDEPRATKNFGREGIKPFAAFNFSLDGIPLLYNGQEWGASEYISLFERTPLNWNKQGNDIFQFYKSLVQLRNKYSALRSRNFQIVENSQPDSVVSFLKNEQLLVVLNFTNHADMIRLSGNRFDRLQKNLLNNKKISLQNNKLKINPFDALILQAD
jgi:cyclomaltodextrinase